jgi:hypothetical protein
MYLFMVYLTMLSICTVAEFFSREIDERHNQPLDNRLPGRDFKPGLVSH